MDRFAALLFFFLLGHYVTATRFSMNGRGVVGLIGLGIAIAGGLISVLHGAIKYDPWFVWVPMGLIAFLLWAAPFYQRGAVTRMFEWIGRNSIVFYAAHFPILLVCTGLAAAYTEVTGAGLYVWLFLVVLALCAGLQKARQHRLPVAALFDFGVARQLVSGRSGKPSRAL
jgi:peptidoglycan/LPS O-acetylase OafA/YrhL